MPKLTTTLFAGCGMMLRSLVPLLCLLTAASAPSAPDAGVPPGPGHPASSGAHSTPTARILRRPLPFFYDLYTFRGEAGSTTVLASFAVPAGRLEQEKEDGEVRYRFEVTFVLADTALRSVSRTDDSVFVSVPHSLDSEHLLHTYVEVQAPPSVSTLQRVIMNDGAAPGIGQLYGSAFPIPDYGGAELMLSDIALGLPGVDGGEGAWKRGDVTIALLPTSQFPEGAFDVYYEVYNLPFGNSYTTEISITPLDDSGAELDDETHTVRTRFTGESATRPDHSLRELRRVETSLSRGRYRLTVRVQDEITGKTAARSRIFQVRGSGQGATLAPAHSRRGPGSPLH